MQKDDPARALTQWDIFLFWLPLYASWLLMTMEGPFVTATINRLPNEEIMLAAQGIVVSLAVTIESPIINMLATATALANDRPSYLLLRRFTIHWMILLTIISILLAFTPLFDLVVRQWMGTPEAIAVWVQVGLQIMIFWSAAIAWRRFLQGVLIRHGRPVSVAVGTGIRLLASAGTALALGLWGGVPGVVVGAIALMAGVVAEAVYATVAVRPVLNNELAPDAPLDPGEPLTYRQLLGFHLPLAATSVLILLTQPLVTTTLARLPNAIVTLAAWPVIFQVLLMARAPAFALPEVVIARTAGRETYIPLRRFSLTLALIVLAGMLLLALTPLLSFYIFVVQDTTTEVGEIVRTGVMLFIPLPMLTVILSWLRGLLIKQKATSAVNIGMVINLIVTGILLFAGLALTWDGIVTAAIALTTALVLEVLFLLWRTQKMLNFGLPFFGLGARPVTIDTVE
jgi:hypothetical protein